MSAETPPETTAEGPAPRAASPRRRRPKQDAVLTEAVELARTAARETAGAQNVGEHVGVTVHEDRLLTHLFASELAGYAGWNWFVTVARAPRSKHVTVCEVGLLAGEGSLLAPPWIPWEQRMQELTEEQGQPHDDAAESRDAADSPDSAGSPDSAESPDADASASDAPSAADDSEHDRPRAGSGGDADAERGAEDSGPEVDPDAGTGASS